MTLALTPHIPMTFSCDKSYRKDNLMEIKKVEKILRVKKQIHIHINDCKSVYREYSNLVCGVFSNCYEKG